MSISPDFSPVTALAGGVLIGIAAALLLWLNGRIAGVSGIVDRALLSPPGDRDWRLAFLIALAGGGALGFLLLPNAAPHAVVDSWPPLVLAGLLVGVGTSYGSGCTSGHGVCGLARRSARSLVATVAFMAAGVATVYVIRHLTGRGS